MAKQELPPNELELKIAMYTGVIPECPFCGRTALMRSSFNDETFDGVPLYQARIACTNIGCNAGVLLNERSLEEAQVGAMAIWARARRAQAQRALLMSDSSQVISEEEVERAFAGTNFGDTDYRGILHTAMLKKACGYHCGHTVTEIMKELRLIGHKGALLKRGIEFLRASYHKQMLDGA